MEEQFRDNDQLQLGICDKEKEETIYDDDDDNDNDDDDDGNDNAKVTKIPFEITHHVESNMTDQASVLSINDQALIISETLGSVGSSYLGSEDELKIEDDETSEKSSSNNTTEDTDNSQCIDDAMEKHKEPFHEISDEEDTGAMSTEPPRSKNEVTYQDLPMEPLCLEIPQDAIILEMGYVQSIVDDLVVIQSTIHLVFDIDSMLCFEDHTVLGRVFETLGPVRQPIYTVRLESSENANQEWVILKKKVYCVSDHSQFVQIQHLKQFKGCDASNRYDEELPEEEQEFSDDEKEADAKKMKTHSKKQLRQKRTINISASPIHSENISKFSTPTERAMVSYEDIDDKVVEDDENNENKRTKVGALTAKVKMRPSIAKGSSSQRSKPSTALPPPSYKQKQLETKSLPRKKHQYQKHSTPSYSYNAPRAYVNPDINNPAVAALAAAIVQAVSDSGHSSQQQQQQQQPMSTYPLYATESFYSQPYQPNYVAPPSQASYQPYQMPPPAPQLPQPYMFYPPTSGYYNPYGQTTSYVQPSSIYPGQMEHYPVPGDYHLYRPPPS